MNAQNCRNVVAVVIAMCFGDLRRMVWACFVVSAAIQCAQLQLHTLERAVLKMSRNGVIAAVLRKL